MESKQHLIKKENDAKSSDSSVGEETLPSPSLKPGKKVAEAEKKVEEADKKAKAQKKKKIAVTTQPILTKRLNLKLLSPM